MDPIEINTMLENKTPKLSIHKANMRHWLISSL